MTCECDCVLHIDPILLLQIPANRVQCECMLCQGGQCRVLISPLNKTVVEEAAVRQSGSCGSNDMVPTLCEDCKEHYLLDLRRQAVKRARDKRKTEELNLSEDQPEPELKKALHSQQIML